MFDPLSLAHPVVWFGRHLIFYLERIRKLPGFGQPCAALDLSSQCCVYIPNSIFNTRKRTEKNTGIRYNAQTLLIIICFQ